MPEIGAAPLTCAECGAVSDEDAAGWRAYLIAGNREANEVVVVCRECADREFGPVGN